jgi:murein DD-endopeptidase MepM/ murein hydrolase activator NlpD
MYPFEGSYKITSRMKFWRDISDKKGGRIQGSHTGVDWGMPVGVPLYASVEGTVIAGTTSVTIHAIDPVTGRSYFAVYHHLSKINVSNGVFVEQGAPIGLSGNTGRSTGPHLHFEIRRDTYKTTWKASANGSPEEIAKFEASCIDPLVGLSLNCSPGGVTPAQLEGSEVSETVGNAAWADANCELDLINPDESIYIGTQLDENGEFAQACKDYANDKADEPNEAEPTE